MESSSTFNVDCDRESLLETPYTDWDCDTFVGSMKDDSSSNSLSSWELVNVVVGEGLCELKEDYFNRKQQTNENGSYDELLKKFIEKEEELRVSNSKLEHSEEKITKLKIQIKQCEGQLRVANEQLKISGNEIGRLIKEVNELYGAQQMALHGEINSLKEEINKELDMHKHKFGIVVTERDEGNAKIDIIKAEIISQEAKFKKMKLKASNRLNLVEELSMKVDELENGVNSMVSATATTAKAAATSAKQRWHDLKT